MDPEYSWIYANTETHAPIISLKSLKRVDMWDFRLGLYYRGKAIGTGRFEFYNKTKKWLHTESVRLNKGFRRKGHGIHLYIALIECARSLGAKRLYSSSNLNRYSSRMWETKLERYGIAVNHFGGCRRPCRHCRKRARHYIEL